MKLEFNQVIILGMGRTGTTCLNFFKNYYKRQYQHNIKIICVDSKPLELENLSFQETDHELIPYLTKETLMIWSPGIPWDTTLMKKCVSQGMTIWSEIELASRFFNKPILALTGTNGKTTTVSLIQHILKKCNINSFLGGNIGTPFIEAIENQENYELAVLELSSFQLEAIKDFHPFIAGVLNLYQSHEERYDCFNDYVTAKVNITNNLTKKDFFVRREDEKSLEPHLKNLECIEIKIPSDLNPKAHFWNELNLDHFPLQGNHNLENLAMAKIFLNKWGVNDKQIESAIKDFQAVPFRLQEIYHINDFKIFNDSKSTNWDATNTALKSFDEKKKPILIMGGKLREDTGIKDLSQKIQFFIKATKFIIVFGEAGPSLKSYFKDKKNLIIVETLECVMEQLISKEFIVDQNLNEDILFSPGYPSFDLYKNYIERGQHFDKLISAIMTNGERYY
ncbi:MAG: UDP-N-acetylmuramoyl-L-alanine--D-glutamate ligase [Bacteriovoracaceae bacterium]|jgi:UDP-N-acetylmuramoylalanine--D-glutamate ligase|nr:UDP-N-acetylmuramoyl-L-alanine--D-glutamate ligase [Bacteriovoracaceae bacterium]